MRRRTEEVDITVELAGEVEINTGDEEFDHLLATLLFYLDRPCKISASWDLRHHLWEDTGIVFGKTLKDETTVKDITRYGNAVVPMDEALVLVSIDISRPYLVFDLHPTEPENGFSLTLAKQFLNALSRSLEATIHLKQLSGENAHHVIEAGFKGLGLALRQGLKASSRIESTKGDLR